jgi:DNA-binding Lrp family transcriptional regulator
MLDEIDLTILDILQKAGRTKRNDLAEAVGLSLPSASERLRKLEEHKIITGYHATLDYRRLGEDLGDLAGRVLAGEAPKTIPIVEQTPLKVEVDETLARKWSGYPPVQ